MKNVLFSIVIGLGLVSHVSAFEGDAKAGKAKAAACAACHGNNGIGIMDAYPNLAGQHADYIAKQLKAFKSGERKDVVMAPMAAALSEQDMADLGAYFSRFGIDGSAPVETEDSGTADSGGSPAQPSVVKVEFVADAKAGKGVYLFGDKERGITACIDCHGKEGNSDVLINPNLSNQHSAYIEKQLIAFKNESRHNMAMNQVAGNLTEEDILNLGAYFKDTSAVGEVTASVAKVAVKSFVGDVALGKTKAATCAACHGSDGNASVAIYPSLAGQSESYLVKQIEDFKSGERADAVMAGMVAGLSDDDIQNVSAYFASQTLAKNVAKTNDVGRKLFFSGRVEKGLAASNVTACVACHSVNGGGMDKAGFPSIAGQSATYLQAQLEKFRDGTRNNDTNSMMQNVAVNLSDDDIKALAEFMAGL